MKSFISSAFIVSMLFSGLAHAVTADEILDATGVKGGLIVHVGCGDGKLTAALRTNERYLVHGLDADLSNVEQAREYIRSLELYGQVSVEHWTKNTLPYTENLVNLVVSENLGGIPMDEIIRVLAPLGIAYIKQDDKWTNTVKPRPKEIDEWTHYLHDASNNAVAHDSVVGPPRRFQWQGSPRWSRQHDHMASVNAYVVAGGRAFYIIDEGSKVSIQLPSRWSLYARDAFNGTVLWKKPIASWMIQMWPFKSGPAQLPRRLVAVGDRVYVTLGMDGTALSCLDAANGSILWTDTDSLMTEEIIYSDGVLFLLVKDSPPETGYNDYRIIHRKTGDNKAYVKTAFAWDETIRWVKAVDAATGTELWQFASLVAPLSLTADANGVYFHDGNSVICLDRTNGTQLWTSVPIVRQDPMQPNYGTTLVAYNGILIFEGGDSEETLTALSAQTGQVLWTDIHAKSRSNSPYDLLVVDDKAWVMAVSGGSSSGISTGWDPKSGEVLSEFPPDVETHWFHSRCYRAKATDNYLLP